MVFSQPTFLFVFLPLVLGAYFLCPGRAKNLLLLFASLAFYAWGEVRHVALIGASITANYGFGLWIGALKARAATGRSAVGLAVALAVTFNLGLLFWFKYAGWLAELTGIGGGGGPFDPLEVALPIGISFFTFQALSYVIDVGRGHVGVQRSPVRFGLYVSLFPQLIAGPIVRYSEIESRLEDRRVGLCDLADGARRFVLGLAKKVLIADSLAGPADQIFGLGAVELSPAVAWFGALCYTLQIYFDFSGYSDMAIGLGRMFGFRFPENFRYPYASQSLTEFWRRWHITLSSWFRDYLYVPLGGNRRGRARTLVNLGLVFLLCGAWHGAALTYVAWGLYHGGILILERLGGGGLLQRLPRPLRHLWLMVVVVFGWVLFRATSWQGLQDMLAAMWGIQGAEAAGSWAAPLTMYLDAKTGLAMAIGAVLATPVYPWVLGLRARATSSIAARGFDFVELCAAAAFGLLCAMSIATDTFRPFLYFQF